jgi:Alpha/beta hydrolase family
MKIDFRDKTVGGFTFEFVRGLSAEESGAAAFGECMETIQHVKNGDFESWIRHWTATADRVSTFAERELANGDTIGAGKAFLRASNYYRMADFYAHPTDRRHTLLWQRSKDAFQRMIPLSQVPIECIEIMFEGARLPAYFVSGGPGVRPTLIALGGFDSTMEEIYGFIGAAAAEYGWHCLIFEGPGQWSALKMNPGLRFRPDYEKPVSAVVDYLLTRPDVDSDKLALIGYSFGGHLAPRAAAGEPRIAACIPNTLVVDCGEAARAGLRGLTNPLLIDTAFRFLMRVNPAARRGLQHAQWTLGIQQPHEWPAAYADFTLKGREKQLRNPMLFLFSEDDIQSSAASTRRIVVGLLDFILSLECDRFVHLFSGQEGASSHCQMGGTTYAQAVIFRWLDHVLCGKPLVSEPDASAADRFEEAFARYGGPAAGRRAHELLAVARLV